MKILKDYYKWFQKFSSFFKELTNESFTFEPFEPNVNFGISEFDLKMKNNKIDDFIFKKIIYFIFFQKAKLSFLLEYKKNYLKELWKQIKELRKEKKLSQNDLAEKSWIDRTFIIFLEKWNTNISYLNLLRICDILDLEIKFEKK